MPTTPFPREVTLTLPEWVPGAIAAAGSRFESLEDRMRLVLNLSRQNFEQDTGGPFAAAVFVESTGQLVAAGVNRVVPMRCSSAHAEVMALTLAQQAIGGYDLGGPGLERHQLVVNWRPCSMCCGAVVWSGVRSLVIGGSGPELEKYTGFDEGPIHPQWVEELAQRGISVSDGVLREQACEVFRAFSVSGRPVYNGRGG